MEICILHLVQLYQFTPMVSREAVEQGVAPAMELASKILIVTSDQTCTILKPLEEITFS